MNELSMDEDEEHKLLMIELLDKRKQDNLNGIQIGGRVYDVSKNRFNNLFKLHTKNKYIDRLFGYDLIWG